MTQTFDQRAQQLGHSVAQLNAGAAVSSTIHVANVDSLKALLDTGEDPAKRVQMAAQVVGSVSHADAPNDPTAAGVLQRTQAFILGAGELHAADRERVAASFPLAVQATSKQDRIVTTNEVLATSQNLFVANWGTLTIQQGGCLTIYNTPAQITVDKVIRTGSPPAGFSDINILGVTGGAGTTGTTSAAGGGSNGSPGNCSSAGISGDSGGHGGDGSVGTVGGEGGGGKDGLASMMATITINSSLTGNLTIATRSGPGGVGGPGGTGSAGGPGGHGGDGATCDCTGNSGGSGSNGGRGGNGGAGGTGGNGVNAAADIAIYVPQSAINLIIPIRNGAPPGVGGPGGAGGQGGGGGGGGGGGKHNSGGSDGSHGGPGATGRAGPAGTQNGSPANISIQPV